MGLRKEVIELCESKPSYKMSLWSMKLELDDMYLEITILEIARAEFDNLIYTMNNFKKKRPPHEEIIQLRNDLATLRDDVLDLSESPVSFDIDLQNIRKTLVTLCHQFDLIDTRTIDRKDLIKKVNSNLKNMKIEAEKITSNKDKYSKEIPKDFINDYNLFVDSIPALESLTKRELGLISDTSKYHTSCFQSFTKKYSKIQDQVLPNKSYSESKTITKKSAVDGYDMSVTKMEQMLFFVNLIS